MTATGPNPTASPPVCIPPFPLNNIPPPPCILPQLPERHELWYDDGTAEPEFYYDRDWLQSNGTAALELLAMFSAIFGTVGVFAYLVDDKFRPVSALYTCGTARGAHPSPSSAPLALLAMFSAIFGTVGVFAYLVYDKFRPVRAL
jgi:hypothetical protein